VFGISDVVHVQRIVVGSNNPADPQAEDKIVQAMALVNKCLTEPPKGRIIGIERSFTILQIGEHNVVLQWLTYHVGFTRRPYWLEEQSQR
jgi:hypothetical protein